MSEVTYTLRVVAPRSGTTDTSREATDELTRIWRSRTAQDRWALLVSLDATVETIARAGIQWANPSFTEVQVDQELFRRRYGDRLTLEAYGSSRSN